MNNTELGDLSLADFPKESEKFSGLTSTVTKEMTNKATALSYFHYTSAAGPKGIVEENTLFFSDTMFMNDGSERQWGLQLLDQAIAGLMTTSSDRVKTFLKVMQDTETGTSEDFRNIVFCMSTEGNLLNQWRDYGKDTVPYCIEIDSKYLWTDQDAAFNHLPMDMIYEESLQKNLLQELITRIFDVMKPYWEKLDEKNLQLMAMRASFQLGMLLEQFKHPAFAAEKEVRLAQSFYHLSQKKVPPKFRSGPLGLTPYYEWKPTARLAIKSVRVGPSPHADASVEALKLFLARNGIEAEATISAIPLRR